MDNIASDQKAKIAETKEAIEDRPVVKEPPSGPKILLESSFILAILNQVDPNNKTASAILGFLTPFNCRFHIPLLVSAEVLSKVVQREKGVAAGIKLFESFMKRLPGTLLTGATPDFDDIVSRYKMFGRKDIKNLQGNDFIIVTEGIISGSVILTCDHEMYKRVKNYHEDIYFVATDSDKYEDDAAKLISRFLKLSAAPVGSKQGVK
ncbi:MAG: hypothetical protein Q7R31_03040 [Candidatus Levybacteria bacterium]|nr:hypothetical protein [Candidatus Levybacteria bacterium]